MINVFIGYDSYESSAFHVLAHSIHRHASQPVSITPVKLSELRGLYTRPRGALHSTEFSLSRFLIPYLSGFSGWSLFMDCDMLCRADIVDLWNRRNSDCAVQVVKHDYTPTADVKMKGQKQTRYEKKNWSSLMLFNNERCRRLTPEFCNYATGLELHQFKWLDDERDIGGLPEVWNWLVGEYEYNPDARMAHFTLGGPWWEESYFCCDYADEWRAELESMLNENGNQNLSRRVSPALMDAAD